jgi:hypothetical protein
MNKLIVIEEWTAQGMVRYIPTPEGRRIVLDRSELMPRPFVKTTLQEYPFDVTSPTRTQLTDCSQTDKP